MPRLRRLKNYDKIEKDPEDDFVKEIDDILELSADECVDENGRTILERDRDENRESPRQDVAGTDRENQHPFDERTGDGKYTSLPTSDTSSAYEETNAARHWLSDEVIISSFSDERLQSALARYENAVRLIRQELARRSLEPKRTTRSTGLYPSDKLAGSLQYLQDQMFRGIEEEQRAARRKTKGTRKQRSPTKSVADALANGVLTPEQVWKVLQEKLKKEEGK